MEKMKKMILVLVLMMATMTMFAEEANDYNLPEGFIESDFDELLDAPSFTEIKSYRFDRLFKATTPAAMNWKDEQMDKGRWEFTIEKVINDEILLVYFEDGGNATLEFEVKYYFGEKELIIMFTPLSEEGEIIRGYESMIKVRASKMFY